MRNLVFLPLILLLAFYLAFIPHIGYAYPFHGDEWMHMAYAGTVAQTGSITFPDPFTGQGEVGVGSNLWVGFHIFWAMFQQVSDIPWIDLFRYFPAIVFMFTVLAVYVLANREGYGLEAAFFTCLIPTTGGLLGPAFMVPMALSLLFIPLSLFLAFNIKSRVTYLLIFLFTCFLLLSHATTAIILCILLLPYALINIRSNTWHSIGLVAALLLPFILPFPWIFKLLVQHAGQLLTPQYLSQYIELPDLLGKYGLLPLIFSFIGSVVLILRGDRKNLGLVLGLAFLLAIMLVFTVFHYGLSGVYDRGLTAMLLILGIFAGAGLFWLRTLRLPAGFLHKHKRLLFRQAGAIYYWRIRSARSATTQIAASPWSEARSFTVKAGFIVNTPYYGVQLLAPNNGCTGCRTKPLSFSWSPWKEATKYQFDLAKDSEFKTLVVTATTTTTGYEFKNALEYSSNYFWRVKAIEVNGQNIPSDWSATFSFTTAPVPAIPPPPEPEAAIPVWVWVLITIGTVLVIAVLFLVFKTRRI